jgi:hypothetical protein
MIETQPFRRYKLNPEERDDQPFTIRLTDSDKVWFIPAQAFIKQPKKSTAMKQLAEIGSIMVLHDKKISKILGIVDDNLRRNKRLGIPESEIPSDNSDANVIQNTVHL